LRGSGPLGTLIRHGLAVPPSPKGEGFLALYKHEENAPEWDVFIHLLEKRAQCALFCVVNICAGKFCLNSCSGKTNCPQLPYQ